MAPGSCSQAGCLAQPSGRWLRALERGSGQSLEAGPEKTSPGLSHQKVRAKERVATLEASRGHPGGLCGHICSTVTAIPGVSCGPACVAKPQSPGTARVQGGGPGRWFCCLSCCGQAACGSRGVEPGAQLEGRQGGSHWFGQITSSKWNHRPVTVFHGLPTRSAARPGVRRGAQAGSNPPGGPRPLPSGGTSGTFLHHPEPVAFSVNPLPAFFGGV